MSTMPVKNFHFCASCYHMDKANRCSELNTKIFNPTYQGFNCKRYKMRRQSQYALCCGVNSSHGVYGCMQNGQIYLCDDCTPDMCMDFLNPINPTYGACPACSSKYFSRT